MVSALVENKTFSFDVSKIFHAKGGFQKMSPSAFAFISTTISTLYHVAMGFVYFVQPGLQGTAQSPATVVDPCGFLSVGYFFSNSTPPLVLYTTDYVTRSFLRSVGLFMMTGGLYFYYETIFHLKFDLSNSFGLVHFYYLLLCFGGFRNHWATVDYLWPWFFFHLLMSLSLLKLKRIRITNDYEDSSEDEDYIPSEEEEDSDDPEGDEEEDDPEWNEESHEKQD